jgi:hypothetical protein
MRSHNQAGADTAAIESDNREMITDVALAIDCIVADPAALGRSLFAVDVLLTSEPRQAIRAECSAKPESLWCATKIAPVIPTMSR